MPPKRLRQDPADDPQRLSHELLSHFATAKRARAYAGLPGYAAVYNQAVLEAFDPGDPAHWVEFSDKRLHATRVNVNGVVECDGGGEGPVVVGTVWTPGEKNAFFGALARYLIHRPELIHAHVPTKLEMEIINYYRILKADAARMKASSKTFHKLISMPEVPIAYEMSEEFVALEEAQARFMQRRDHDRDRANHVRFKGDLLRYVRAEGEVVGMNQLGEEESGESGESGREDREGRTEKEPLGGERNPYEPRDGDNPSSLLNYRFLVLAAKRLYSQNSITSQGAYAKPEWGAVQHLEGVLLRVLSRIMVQLARDVSLRVLLGTGQEEVTANDVHQAVRLLQMEGDWKREGLMDEYLRGMGLRLGFVVVGENGKQVAGRVTEPMRRGVDRIVDSVHRAALSFHETPEAGGEEGSGLEESDGTENQRPRRVVRVEALRAREEPAFVDSPVAEALFLREAEVMESLDARASARYESFVLRVMGSYGGKVKSEAWGEEWWRKRERQAQREQARAQKQQQPQQEQRQHRARRKTTPVPVVPVVHDDGDSDYRNSEPDASGESSTSEESESPDDAPPTITPEQVALHSYDFACYSV